MIASRRWIDRGLRYRILRIVVIAFQVALLVGVAVHEGGDQIAGGGELCLALALVILSFLLPRRHVRVELRTGRERARARPPTTRPLPPSTLAPSFLVPLRL